MASANIISHRFISLDGLHGDGLKQLRQALGITQSELARLAGISRSTISNIETNRQEPTLGTIIQIRDALLECMERKTIKSHEKAPGLVIMDVGVLQEAGAVRRLIGRSEKKLTEFE